VVYYGLPPSGCIVNSSEKSNTSNPLYC